VSSMPSATIARLSPTNTMSIAAWSATCAEGKSWAVIIVMGSFLRYIDMSDGNVTFFRVAEAELRGECEDCRMSARVPVHIGVDVVVICRVNAPSVRVVVRNALLDATILSTNIVD